MLKYRLVLLSSLFIKINTSNIKSFICCCTSKEEDTSYKRECLALNNLNTQTFSESPKLESSASNSTLSSTNTGSIDNEFRILNDLIDEDCEFIETYKNGLYSNAND